MRDGFQCSAVFDSSRFALGGINQVYFSTDRGANWKKSFVNWSGNLELKDMSAVNAHVGFAVGGSLIMKTQDGGQTWNPVAQLPNQMLGGVKFVSPDTGFVFNNSNGCWRTFDGGVHWAALTLPLGISAFKSSIDFFNGQVGYSSSSKKLYRTTNSGQTWLLRQSLDASDPKTFGSIKALGREEVLYQVYAGSLFQQQIFVSQNGGLAGESNLSIHGYLGLSQIYGFRNQGGGKLSFRLRIHGVYVGFNQLCASTFYGTSDFGQSWTELSNWDCENQWVEELSNQASTYIELFLGKGQVVLSSTQNLDAVEVNHGVISYNESIFALPSSGYASGLNKGLTLFKPGFAQCRLEHLKQPSWQPSFNEYGFSKYQFLGGERFLAHDKGDLMDQLYFVDSLGKKRVLLISSEHDQVLFVKDSSLVATLGQGNVMHLFSLPSGHKLDRNLPEPPIFSVPSHCLPFNDSAYVFAQGNKIYKTTDSAKTWSLLSFPDTNGRVDKLFFFNPQEGLAYGKHISKTTDGGQTWALADGNTYTTRFTSIHFLNASVGFALANKLMKTTNGGLTWTTDSPEPNLDNAQLVFNTVGEGLLCPLSKPYVYYYQPLTGTWLKENIPGQSHGPVSFDPYRNQWVAAMESGDVMLRLGQPYNPEAQMLVLNPRLCEGDSIQIQTRFRNISSPRQVEVQLSDAQGLFLAPTVLGTFALDSTAEDVLRSFAFALPAGLPFNTTFQIRLHGVIDFQSSEVYHQFRLLTLPQAQAGNDQTLCQHSTGFLTGTPENGIWFSPTLNVDGSLKSGNPPGVYPAVYQVNISSTCFSRDTLWITLQASPEADSIYLQNGILMGHTAPGYLLQWVKNGQPVPFANDSSLLVTGPGVYWLEIQSGNGCSSQSNHVVITGQTENQASRSVLIYPNPTVGELHVQALESGRFWLFNALGAEVAQFQLMAGEEKILRADVFPSGPYCLKVQKENGIEVQKVLMKE